ncbi:MAG TPA: alpha/beta hydrolase [Bacteroidetes bacterium]|nr:alpha/beta hydrolase [Bacteroidota bacterium]
MSSESLEHAFIKVNGIQLHYVTQGKGPLLLLLHGFPEFWYGWRKQIPVFAKHFRVVVPDLRGYNLSEKPKGVQAYSMEEVRKDLEALIIGLGAEKAIVIGHDWGGAVAYDLVIRSPQLVERFVACNIPHPLKLVENLKGNWRQKLRSWYFLYFQIPWLPEFLFKLMLRRVLKRTFQGWAYNPKAFSDEDVERYREALLQPGALKASINYYRAFFRNQKQAVRGLEVPITVPTRIIWGENDKALGKELTYDLEQYFAAPFDVHYLENCSHWVMSEYPDRVSALVLDFLGIEDLPN